MKDLCGQPDPRVEKALSYVRRAMLALTIVLPLVAQTTVVGPLNVPIGSGQLFNGSLTIEAPPMKFGGNTYQRWRERVDVINGVFSLVLIPNDAATVPTGFRNEYVVRAEVPTKGVSWEERWLVPTSATTVKVADVRNSTVVNPAISIPLTQLSLGTATSGQCLVSNSTGWAPGMCSVGGAAMWGSIGGTLSNQVDLSGALAGKEPALPTGNATQVLLGDKTLRSIAALTFAWGQITSGVPTVFPPSPHSHTASDISDFATAARSLLSVASASRMTYAAGVFDLATVVTPGTAAKVTYDAYGRVVSGSPLSFGDIPNNGANTTGNAGTATSFAANGSNCTNPGEFAKGIDASGNAEGCAVPAGSGTEIPTVGSIAPWVPPWFYGGSSTLAVAAVNRVHMSAFCTAAPFGWSRFTARITTAAAGSQIGIALYSTASSKIAGTEAVLNSTAAAVLSGSAASAVSVAPGCYYLAYSANNTTVTINAVALGASQGGLLNGTANRNFTCANTADFGQSLGSIFPATCGTQTAATTVPMIVLE